MIEPKSAVAYQKYQCLYRMMKDMNLRTTRAIFALLKRIMESNEIKQQGLVNHNVFFPKYGITLGEFATFQILTEERKQKRE